MTGPVFLIVVVWTRFYVTGLFLNFDRVKKKKGLVQLMCGQIPHLNLKQVSNIAVFKIS